MAVLRYPRWKLCGVLCLQAAALTSLWAQERVSPASRLPTFDLQVLESDASRVDLPCQVTRQKPFLGFDLQLHADYITIIPVKDLRDAGERLTVVMRVTPAANPNQQAYFVQPFRVPAIPADTKGDAMLSGGIALGYGRYQVDWMIHDASQRVCSSHWVWDVKPSRAERNAPSILAPGIIADNLGNTTASEPRVDYPVKLRHVKILLDLSPPMPQQAALDAKNVAVLLSMLRSITSELDIEELSVVAFNVWQHKIVARQDRAGMIDLTTLAEAAQAPNGIVNYRDLQKPQGEADFLAQLLASELKGGKNPAEPIIIVGTKVTLAKKVHFELSKENVGAPGPVFYLNYDPDPLDQPWPDSIRSALETYPGAMAYNITDPQDLAGAMKNILSRMKAHIAQWAG